MNSALLPPPEIEAAVRAERLRLGDYLTDLDAADWDVRSLCTAWTVREVVAHLTTATRATIRSLLVHAIKARGNFDRMEADQAHADFDVHVAERWRICVGWRSQVIADVERRVHLQRRRGRLPHEGRVGLPV